jgi:soluble lytic murein transglycosylase
MLPRTLQIVLACVLALSSGAAASQSALTAADPQLPLVRAAIQAAELGQFNAAQYGSLSGHPLYGWIEYAALKRDIDTLPDAQGQAFLARYKGQAVAEAFR